MPNPGNLGRAPDKDNFVDVSRRQAAVVERRVDRLEHALEEVRVRPFELVPGQLKVEKWKYLENIAKYRYIYAIEIKNIVKKFF